MLIGQVKEHKILPCTLEFQLTCEKSVKIDSKVYNNMRELRVKFLPHSIIDIAHGGSNQEVTAASANAMHSSRRPAKISPKSSENGLAVLDFQPPQLHCAASRGLDCALKNRTSPKLQNNMKLGQEI